MAVPPEYEYYRELVVQVLGNFQFMEEALRIYLNAAYVLINEKLDGAMPFTYEYADNDKDALGTLISKFEKVNANAPLIKELKDLVKSRNEIAHRAILLMSEKPEDVEHLKKLIGPLESLRSRTRPCVEAVLTEAGDVQKKTKRYA